jgi:colanic acid/amylovoran biosynthesis glycosyltransferase
MPTIGHVMPAYLPRTETFTDGLIRGMRGWRHRIFTTRTENLDLFPTRDLVVAASEDDYARLARDQGVDILLAHFGPSGLAALPSALALEIPLVTIFHGYDMSMLLREGRWIDRYRTTFRFGARGITVCDAGRQRLVAAGMPADRIETIHLGVDLSRLIRPPRTFDRLLEGHGRLLMVARLTEKKGIDVALRAMRRCRAVGGHETLCIIGAGELREALTALTRELDLHDRVEFVGPQDAPSVLAAMRESDVLLQPSRTASNGDAEGIPVALMEAMALGLPVVTTTHSGIPELVEHGVGGLVADEGDDCALALCLTRLASEPDLAPALAAGARSRVEQEFNQATQAARYAAALERILAEHRAPHAPPAAVDPVLAGGTLYIRAAPLPLALAQLDALSAHAPRPLHVLTSRGSADVFQGAGIADRVHSHADGRISIHALDADVLETLRARRFVRVVIGCGPGAGGYENVLTVAEACAPGEILMQHPSLALRTLERRGAHP